MSGTWTIADMFAALSYARDQINYEKCNDANNKICGPNTQPSDCLVWKENNIGKTWSNPSFISKTTCTSSNDCAKVIGAPDCISGTCSFIPDSVHSGTCNIKTKDFCNLKSKLPYQCDISGKKCTFIKEPQKCNTEDINNKKKCSNGFYICKSDSDCTSAKCENGICKTTPNTEYTEWRSNITCSEDEPCLNGLNCIDGKCTNCKNDGDCPGASTCDESGTCTGGRCILGNWPLRQWCEVPTSRCTPNDDGTYPEECKGSSVSPGVTDVPPFLYIPETGKCHITKDYCDRFGLQYQNKEGSVNYSCTSVQDCIKDGENIEDWACVKNVCTGTTSQCNKGAGQAFGEFFVGNTIFRWFHNGFKCKQESYEPKKLGSQLNDLFHSFPEKIIVKADEKDMLDKKLLYKNYIGTINLYYIQWKDDNIGTGLDASEVYKEFPETVFKQNGKKVIIVKKSDVISGKDQKLKKLYLTLNSLKTFDDIFTK